MEKSWKGRLAFLLLAFALPWVIRAADPALLSAQGRAFIQADGDIDTLPDVEEAPMVALTFDDGPRRSTTGKLLEGLARRGVHATFFLVGEMAEGNDDLISDMAAQGHQIGVHTYEHVWLTDLSAADFQRQVSRTRELIRGMVGEGSYFLRPPYGGVDTGVEKRSNSPIILWSVDPEDWKDKDVERIVNHILSNVRDGDIILLHDIYQSSVEAALRVVDELHERGFLFGTVEELAQYRHVELENGKVYRCFYP
ncbi:MAG: polysaccharide deacetylase family protein [Oscillospiraceae bacterium]|nr:polysaccharide deacetylase family protein [Oscillospiraceae bacterium]